MNAGLAIVWDHSGKPLKRAIVHTSNEVAFVCSERALVAPDAYPPPIGFPFRDVFCFDGGWFARARQVRENSEAVSWMT